MTTGGGGWESDIHLPRRPHKTPHQLGCGSSEPLFALPRLTWQRQAAIWSGIGVALSILDLVGG